MAPQLIDCSTSDHEKHVEDVHVWAAPDGGWDITAVLDGRVVCTRHCTDWHRAERARRQLEFMLHVRLREIAAGGVLLFMLIFAGAGTARAQVQGPLDVAGVFSELRVIGRNIEFANGLMKSGNGGEVTNAFLSRDLEDSYVVRDVGTALGSTGRMASERQP